MTPRVHNITFISSFLAFKNVLYILFDLILQFSFLAESNFRGWIFSLISEKPRNTRKFPAREKNPVYSKYFYQEKGVAELSADICLSVQLLPSNPRAARGARANQSGSPAGGRRLVTQLPRDWLTVSKYTFRLPFGLFTPLVHNPLR